MSDPSQARLVGVERALLGALLLQSDRLLDVVGQVSPEHFFRAAHQHLYRGIVAVWQAREPVDYLTLQAWLSRHALLEPVGGVAYLASLTDGLPRTTPERVQWAAAEVRKAWALRQVRELAGRLEQAAADSDADPAEIIRVAETTLADLSVGRDTATFVPIGDTVLAASRRLAAITAGEAAIPGTIRTGYPELDALTRGLAPGSMTVLAARPSMGKAQPVDAPVLLRDGRWRPIGTLRVGDSLASVDGGESRVVGVFPQGVKQIYRVTFSDGRSAECCDEHLWCVRYRDWSAPRVVPTWQLQRMLTRKRYRGRLWIDTASGDFGADESLPLDPWVLGVLLGDGNFCNGSVRVTTADDEILTAIKTRLPDMELTPCGGYDYRIVTKGGANRAGVSGTTPNRIKEALRDLALLGLGSEGKFVPERYRRASRDVRLAVLRGLLDTDGWAERWGSVRFCSISRQLAEDVVELVRSLGGTCSIRARQTSYTHLGERRQGQVSYVVNICYANPRELFSLARKVERAPATWKRMKRPTVATIEPTRVEDAVCIAVSHESHLYVTSDYVVTHNTALAVNVACRVAGQGLPVGVFSLEQSAEELTWRALFSEARVNGHVTMQGYANDADQRALGEAMSTVGNLPVWLHDGAGLSLPEMRAQARRLQARQGLALVVIDYLQLIEPTGRHESRTSEVTALSRGVKAMAKDLRVPVLVLSQLSRDLEKRPLSDRRPRLSDLRDSGAIEQDADNVWFLHREAVYAETMENRNKAELLVSKNRNGPLGTIDLWWHGAEFRFEEAA